MRGLIVTFSLCAQYTETFNTEGHRRACSPGEKKVLSKHGGFAVKSMRFFFLFVLLFNESFRIHHFKEEVIIR